jgi:hypothetical protein
MKSIRKAVYLKAVYLQGYLCWKATYVSMAASCNIREREQYPNRR